MLSALLSIVVLAQTPAPPPAAPPRPARAKKLCRDAPDLGTRVMRPRICKTADQWSAETQRTRDLADRYNEDAETRQAMEQAPRP